MMAPEHEPIENDWDAIFAAGRALEARMPVRHGACDNCGRPSNTFICPRCEAWDKGKVAV